MSLSRSKNLLSTFSVLVQNTMSKIHVKTCYQNINSFLNMSDKGISITQLEQKMGGGGGGGGVGNIVELS